MTDEIGFISPEMGEAAGVALDNACRTVLEGGGMCIGKVTPGGVVRYDAGFQPQLVHLKKGRERSVYIGSDFSSGELQITCSGCGAPRDRYKKCQYCGRK